MLRTSSAGMWPKGPMRREAALASAALVAGLVGLAVGGPWRWLAIPACLLVGVFALAWRRSAGVAQAAFERSQGQLLDFIEFPTQSLFLCDANGGAIEIGSRWTDWTGMDVRAVAEGHWGQALHDEDRVEAEAAWAKALATATSYHQEYRVRFVGGQYRWLRCRAYPRFGADGTVTHWIGALEDIHDGKIAQEQLRQAAGLLEMIGNSTESVIYAKDREGRMLYINRALEKRAGVSLSDVLGKRDAEWAPNPEEAAAFAAADGRVLDSGEPEELDETFTGSDGATRHYQTIKSPLRDPSGAVIGVVGVATDVTEQRSSEQREKLLARELDHRAKNMLAVVQAVVALTRASSLADFKTAVEGRLHALGRAHSMLAATRWEGADLQRIVDEELAPFAVAGSDQISLTGPSLMLRPAAAQSLALVIHELATNAVKYGALSTADGQLEIGWEPTTDEGAEESTGLRLTWTETLGPGCAAATAPRRNGFGSRLIRSSIEGQLGGRLQQDWTPAGLAARIEIPLDRSIAAHA